LFHNSVSQLTANLQHSKTLNTFFYYYNNYKNGGYTEQHMKCKDGVMQSNFGDRRLVTGDVLEIKLDQKNHRLEYSVNGKSLGVAFNNLPSQQYKLGITLGITSDNVTLLDE